MYSTVSAFRALFLATAVLALAGLGASCGKPPPPSITRAPSAAPEVVDERGVVTLSVEAAVDEEERTLQYEWAQVSPAAPVGTFSAATEATTTWSAPAVTETTTFVFRVTIRDGVNRDLSAEVRVAVVDVPLVNRPPVVSETITAPASAFAGDPVALAITVQDPEGDPLTIAWSQLAPAAAGVFSGAGSVSATWRSPDVAASTAFEFQVSVTDGENPPVLRTVQVQLEVPTYGHVQQVFSNCGGCHAGAAPEGNLDLQPDASYAQLVNVEADCDGVVGGIDRVEPGNPDASSLILKMTGATCGDRMPPNDPAFFDRSPGLVTRVRSWILAGANP